MTDVLSQGALEDALRDIDGTPDFEVKFSGGNFTAYNLATGKQVRGHIVPGVNSQNQDMLERVVSELRWPPTAPAAVKNKPFTGPPKSEREKYLEVIERVKRQGREDSRIMSAQELQQEFDLTGLNITYEPTLIGPKEAEEFLLTFGGIREDGRPVQRSFSRHRMMKYVDQMVIPGAWYLSPDPFVYDENGRGVNGQHRAMAILYTGLTLLFMVSRGWKGKETFKALDKGLARTSRTTLFLEGEQYPGPMNAAAVLLHKAEKVPLIPAWNDNKGMRPEEARILQIVNTRPALREAVRWAKSGTPRAINANVLAVARCLAAEACGQGVVDGVVTYDMEPTAEYFNSLQTGESLSKGNPAHTARRYIETTGAGDNLRQSERLDAAAFQMYLFLRGWNLHVQREQWPSVSYRAKEVAIPKALRPAHLPRLETTPSVHNP